MRLSARRADLVVDWSSFNRRPENRRDHFSWLAWLPLTVDAASAYTDFVKKISDTVLDTVGRTPLIRINRITRDLVSADVLAKVETFNPGNSIKDRIAVHM